MQVLSIVATAAALFVSMLLGTTSADLPPSYQSLTAAMKQSVLWSQIVASPYPLDKLPTAEPNLFQLASLFSPLFDKVSFTHVGDELPSGRQKLIHVYGSAAQVRLNILANSSYSGIFQSGGIGIVRLSLAKQDYSTFTPGLGLKILIDGQPSQNFQVMWSVDGQGTNKNFFQHTFSNIIPEAKSFALKLIENAFNLALYLLPGSSQDRPVSPGNLGLYEQASVTASGQPVSDVIAPYQVLFLPNPAVGWDPANTNDVRLNLLTIPSGTTLYTVVAKKNATDTGEVIGDLQTTSEFVASAYEDAKLFFQHAAKRWRK